MKDNGKQEKSMEKAIFLFKMVVFIRESFILTRFMVEEHTSGLKRRNMKVNGNITKWLEMAS